MSHLIFLNVCLADIFGPQKLDLTKSKYFLKFLLVCVHHYSLRPCNYQVFKTMFVRNNTLNLKHAISP